MFSPKDPLEVVTITFDFSALTSSVSAPVITVTSSSGALDPNPSAVLSGVPQVNGAQVMQQVALGQDQTYYEFKCKITAADGVSKYVLTETMPCLSA